MPNMTWSDDTLEKARERSVCAGSCADIQVFVAAVAAERCATQALTALVSSACGCADALPDVRAPDVDGKQLTTELSKIRVGLKGPA